MGFDWPIAIGVGLVIAVFVYIRAVRAEKQRTKDRPDNSREKVD